MLLFKRLEIYTPVFDYGGSVAYVVTFGLGFIFDIICALTNALTICISWCVGWFLFIYKQISGLEKAEDQAFTSSIKQRINSTKADDPNIEKSHIDTLEEDISSKQEAIELEMKKYTLFLDNISIKTMADKRLQNAKIAINRIKYRNQQLVAYQPVVTLATYLMSHIQQDHTITNEQKRRASLMLMSPMIITQLLQGNYLKMKGLKRRKALAIENDQSRSWEIQYEKTNLGKKYLKLILSAKTVKYYGSHNQVSQKHVYQAIYDYNDYLSYEKNDTDVLVRRANSIFVGSYQYHPCGYNKSITENSNRERVYLKNLGKEDDHTCYALLEMRLTHQNKLLEEYDTTKTNSEQTQDQEGRHILEQDVARLRAQLHDYEIKQTISGQTQGQIDRDILEKNVIRLGTQFLAIVGRGCMQLDCFMGHNIVCKTIPNSDGSETKQLNVIDFQSIHDQTGIDIMDCFITKLIEDTQYTDLQKSMLESNAMFNKETSSIFTMLAYCVLVEQGFKCGANTTITSSQQAIYNEARTTRINMVKILMSGDVDVVQSRRAFKEQFKSNCLGLGKISEAMIDEQYNELGIPVRFRTPRPLKEVKLITCEQLETSSLHAPK